MNRRSYARRAGERHPTDLAPGTPRPVIEIMRTNDMVGLSYAQALLKDADIACVVFDQHTSVLEGSVLAIERRLLVGDEDAAQARRVLVDAGLDVRR